MDTKQTILLVDDTPDNLIVMTKVINKEIPDTRTATIQKPWETMGFLQASDVSVAVIDVQMPGINGQRSCREI